MKKYYIVLIFLNFFLLFLSVSHAAPYYGAHITSVLVGKEPSSIRGAQVMFVYDPGSLNWKKSQLYFDGGISQFWANTLHHSALTIYSIAPVFRLKFINNEFFSPFIELSIGLAYLNHTRLANRNLGIHFAFQDRLGLGIFLGKRKQFSLGLQAIHYSNAHLSNHNSGITAPIILDLGYRFQEHIEMG